MEVSVNHRILHKCWHLQGLRCSQNFLELIWREKWRVNRSRYCIIGEITRLFCHFFSFFSKYLVLYFTHHFEKYVFYRNFEKYNAYVLLILALNESLVKVTQIHNHDADIADCELKEVLAKVQDLAATTMTTNHNIVCSVTGPMSQDARARSPTNKR